MTHNITDITETVNTCYEAIHGKTMTPNKAIGGVLNSSDPEWLHDDTTNAICPEYDQYIKDHPDDEYGDEYCDNGDDTYLIGFKLNSDNEYEPDVAAEYSAIVSSPYTQVVRSKYTSKCAMCSLCYPGQGDLDTPGDQITYTLPPDVFGDADHLPIERIGDN